ncbi:hypothetical protein [Acidovorax sp.]|uniref:hypothetical protein n=1 Tax=Acidovorax sp. TaxID=1872122 RepID=UPI002F9BFFEF
MNDIAFTSRTGATAGHVRESSAALSGGQFVTVYASQAIDRVELGLLGDMAHCWMVFTAAQARSVAAELPACAAAREAKEGGAV